MELWRRAANPWGQDVLIGIAWDLMWAAVIVGLAFVVGHALYVWKLAPKAEKPVTPSEEASANVPERVLRHSVASRTFHWVMSVAMFALLITAFFPVIGIRFPWVTIHWIAGVALLLTVVYHIVHATFWHDFWSMWIDRAEIKDGAERVKEFFRRSAPSGAKAGKYPLDHKLYHHTIAVVTVVAIGTGLLMMFRVDTWFWARNPYILSDALWGLVYVAHGLAGVALITLVAAHVYFGIRPDKWWITLSMINGWIRREDYLAHHDPKRWIVAPKAPAEVSGVGGAVGQGVAQDEHPPELS